MQIVTNIPDNATNGDVIEAMFPDFRISVVGNTILLERHMPYCKMQFHRDWWNAPYQKGGK